MALPFRSHLHAGRLSMKYSWRSKRGGRRKEEVKYFDASMVKTKEDFMKIMGLKMSLLMNVKEEDAMVERKSVYSTASLRIRECSVVIVGENCNICGLLFKSISDVIFHTKMRHGDGFSVCGKYIKASMAENKEKCDANIRRRRTSNDNGNKLRVKIKIGDEIISEISMNRKHLNRRGSAVRTKIAHHEESNEVVSTTLKNDYKSNVHGIDSFVSSKNYCGDYVMSVQPLNHAHQRAHCNSPLLEGSPLDGNSNYVQATRDSEDSEIQKTNMDLLMETSLRCNLSFRRDIIYNNNNSNKKNNNDNNNSDNSNNGIIINYDTDDNNDNNNNESNIRDFLICEGNMSDKENESERGRPVKNFMNVETSMQDAETNLPSLQTNDDDEIQEILRITRRKCINSHANKKRKLEYPAQRFDVTGDREKIGRGGEENTSLFEFFKRNTESLR